MGLVASRKRGQGVLAGLQVSDEQLARVHTPAGLDIGARTPAEIAVAIVAEILSLRSRDTAPVECVVPGVVSGAARHAADGVSPIPAD